MHPEGLTCIRVVFGSGGAALGWSTENMINPKSEESPFDIILNCATGINRDKETH